MCSAFFEGFIVQIIQTFYIVFETTIVRIGRTFFLTLCYSTSDFCSQKVTSKASVSVMKERATYEVTNSFKKLISYVHNDKHDCMLITNVNSIIIPKHRESLNSAFVTCAFRKFCVQVDDMWLRSDVYRILNLPAPNGTF